MIGPTPSAGADAQGCLALVLHAHLPFVRHPEHDVFLEENWLYEAITETYLPLLGVFERLTADGVPFKITMSITPPLAAMLSDELLQSRYARRIGQLIELALKEVERTRRDPPFDRLARMYLARFVECERLFNEWYKRDLIGAFSKFRDLGVLEIMTSAATHGYLPLMTANARAIRAQVRTGIDEHARLFGRAPGGFWLPECGYAPGIDEILAECGVRYSVLEAHGIAYARPRPRFGVYAPVFCPSGVAMFGRDIESSRQVWSAIEGYPGDHHYREFYRDVGYDLDYDYIRPYIHPDGDRIDTGIKYYRITGADRHKEAYDPILARRKADEHAADFVLSREKQLEHLAPGMGRRPIIVAPYDAELFGHWWYEGPDWLELLFRKTASEQNVFETVTLAEHLAENAVNQRVQPCASSWGWKGYHEIWLEGSNDWIYRRLHAAVDEMRRLAAGPEAPDGLERRALNQAARELLLAQSSDWAFIMKTGTAVEYAIKRTRDHLERFDRLAHELRSRSIDEARLSDLETRDNIFPEIDYRVYA